MFEIIGLFATGAEPEGNICAVLSTNIGIHAQNDDSGAVADAIVRLFDSASKRQDTGRHFRFRSGFDARGIRGSTFVPQARSREGDADPETIFPVQNSELRVPNTHVAVAASAVGRSSDARRALQRCLHKVAAKVGHCLRRKGLRDIPLIGPAWSEIC